MSEELTTLGEWLVSCTTAQILLDASCQKGLGLLVQKLQRSIQTIEMLEKRRIYIFVNKPKAKVKACKSFLKKMLAGTAVVLVVWENMSLRGGVNGIFQELVRLLWRIQRGQRPREIPRSSLKQMPPDRRSCLNLSANGSNGLTD